VESELGRRLPLLDSAARRGYIPLVTTTRVFADRRDGVDRRAVPRRIVVGGVPGERRRVVDRRHGAERRSTLERRSRPQRDPALEGPGEHVPMFDAAVARLRRALEFLEKRH